VQGVGRRGGRGGVGGLAALGLPGWWWKRGGERAGRGVGGRGGCDTNTGWGWLATIPAAGAGGGGGMRCERYSGGRVVVCTVGGVCLPRGTRRARAVVGVAGWCWIVAGQEAGAAGGGGFSRARRGCSPAAGGAGAGWDCRMQWIHCAFIAECYQCRAQGGERAGRWGGSESRRGAGCRRAQGGRWGGSVAGGVMNRNDKAASAAGGSGGCS